MSLIYRFARWLLRMALKLYYTEIEVHGAERMPDAGPVMVLANHTNGMVDPFLLIAASDRPVRFLAKAPLFKIPILSFFMRHMGVVPVYRSQDPGYAKEKNEQLYVAVGEALAAGGAVALFPEGKSHTESSLAEFKHGASKMALEAESRAGFGLGLRVQLVGIHFERTRLFRGKALVTFGPPMTVEAHRERYAADARAATEALTAELHERLSRMVLDAESHEIARLAALVEKLGVLEEEESGLKGAFDRKKALLDAYERLKAKRPDDVEDVLRALRRYEQMLRLLGVRDDHIAADYRWGRVLWYSVKNPALLLLAAPLMAAGVLMNGAPYWLVRFCVFLAGPHIDVRASSGLLVAILAFPLWYAGLCYAGWRAVDWRIWVPVVSAGPALGFAAVRWFERFRALRKEAWALWMAMRLPTVKRKLRDIRRRILQKIESLRDVRDSTGSPS